MISTEALRTRRGTAASYHNSRSSGMGVMVVDCSVSRVHFSKSMGFFVSQDHASEARARRVPGTIRESKSDVPIVAMEFLQAATALSTNARQVFIERKQYTGINSACTPTACTIIT